MTHSLRWGVLSTGNIARQFCASMGTARRGRVEAVASRDFDRARSFAKAHGIPLAVASYDQLVRHPQVDAVYNALPNSMHHEWTLAALAAGKHVLCEKPFATDTAEAKAMFAAADRADRLLVEAFMYRSHPQTDAVLKAVAEGAIGRLRLIRTSFCFRTTKTEGNIRFSPALAGGGLMDIGCYCIDFSKLFARAEPTRLFAAAELHGSGVDEVAVGSMQFPGGILASFTCGMSVHADNTAYLCGTDGFIEIPVPWKPPVQNAVWHLSHSAPPRMDSTGTPQAPAAPLKKTFTTTAGADLYALEADDFAAAVLDGAPPRVTRESTLGTMRVLDELRNMIRPSS